MYRISGYLSAVRLFSPETLLVPIPTLNSLSGVQRAFREASVSPNERGEFDDIRVSCAQGDPMPFWLTMGSGRRDLGWNPGKGLRLVLLGKTLSSHSASFHTEV